MRWRTSTKTVAALFRILESSPLPPRNPRRSPDFALGSPPLGAAPLYRLRRTPSRRVRLRQRNGHERSGPSVASATMLPEGRPAAPFRNAHLSSRGLSLTLPRYRGLDRDDPGAKRRRSEAEQRLRNTASPSESLLTSPDGRRTTRPRGYAFPFFRTRWFHPLRVRSHSSTARAMVATEGLAIGIALAKSKRSLGVGNPGP